MLSQIHDLIYTIKFPYKHHYLILQIRKLDTKKLYVYPYMIQLVGGEAVFELSLHGLPRVHVFSWKHSFRSHLTVEQVDLIISKRL